MNFFAEQERARRKTLLLGVLMTAAVISLILMTALAISMILYFIQWPIDSPRMVENMQTPWKEHFLYSLNSSILLYAAIAVVATVAGGSLYKFFQLGGNGRRVAEALNGRMILANTTDPLERRMLNVVEEMAIASGNPVPPVYVLDEPGINAFAAGTDRRNAVIGVTRGCLELLNREELQGVVAHEFSHIHNGDMKLNLRLVAVLHGILLIGLIGSYMLRSSSSRSRNKNHGAVVGMGLALVVLGYCGIFFGNLIKAAVSRQREFLADASAVQFTRNPTGISNALRKIGGHSEHAILHNARASEFSHMYFGQGLKSALGGLMATHPPLPLRIRKILPRWDGSMITPTAQTAVDDIQPKPSTTAAGFSTAAASLAQVGTLSAAIEQVGNPTEENLKSAQVFLMELPKSIYAAAHEPFSCRALIYWLLMDQNNQECRRNQWQILQSSLDAQTLQAMKDLEYDIKALQRADYLSVVDLAMPALKTLSASQYQEFKKELAALIKADDKISLFEWCLYRIVTSGCEDKTVHGTHRLPQLQEAVQTLLTAACQGQSEVQFAGSLAAAERHLSGVALQKEASRTFSIAALDAAMKQLQRLRPLEKPTLLKALAACMEADKKITQEEIELFRAVADCLDCPVPPLGHGLDK
ncbi:hypothetical protein DWB84_17900 [Saccharophagus sp. K07]|uniref:M48 family metallopeptidase n=1 Tax=Saccharophagus sp. K07 TaxID=2283636 RepID=UPI001651D2B7|nr:M48 family metallopeptidase [Saccharophagus sp. K07]MBC6907315.1 hypothetical protein [Saccharophagus sp. K07]